MRDVRALRTTQIRLFQPDIIPYTKLIFDRHQEWLQTQFSFKNIDPVVHENALRGVRCNAGCYGETLIHFISIEERRISLSIEGPSKTATEIYDQLRKNLAGANNDRKFKEILCTHETACSVVLNIPFERLFSKQLRSFLDTSAKKRTANKWSENFIMPSDLKFTVRYKVTDDNLVENNITLAPKQLVIEPRIQSAIDERLYFIASPTDSDTHFKLIDEFEKAFAAGS